MTASWLRSWSFTLAITSLILLGIGYVIPFWVSFAQENSIGLLILHFDVYIGIWYVQVCQDGDAGDCATETIATDFSISIPDLVFTFLGTEPRLVAKAGAVFLGK